MISLRSALPPALATALAFGTSLLTTAVRAADRPWLHLNDATAAEAATRFETPPPENGMVLWWGWDGPVNHAVIRNDLDRIKAMGFAGVMIEAGKGMEAKYLSPAWFDLFKYAVEQARDRNLRVWVEDEGKYPSGFAGGRFTRERPDLCMQVVAAGEQFDVAGGETVARRLAPETICAVAYELKHGGHHILDITGGTLKRTAPAGTWQVVTTRHVFRSGPTAWVDNPTGTRKDNAASLCDYLNPEATRKIIEWTYQLVRGINLIQVMFMPASSGGRTNEPGSAPGVTAGQPKNPAVARSPRHACPPEAGCATSAQPTPATANPPPAIRLQRSKHSRPPGEPPLP